MTSKKWTPKPDTTPFYDVIIRDPKKVVQAIVDGEIPIGAIQINLAYLKTWAREQIREDKNTLEHISELGLMVRERTND
jgi:hypothetical protein